MPPQPILRPGPQRVLRGQALIRLHAAHPAPGRLVPAQVLLRQLQVVLPDGVDPGHQPVAVNGHAQRCQVPPPPHLAGGRRGRPADVQPEGHAAQVVFPHRVLQGAAHRLQRLPNGVPIEAVGLDYIVIAPAQRPDALVAQDLPDRRRGAHAAVRSAHGLRVEIRVGDVVLQAVDDVLQRQRPGARVILLLCGLHPPHGALARLRVLQQPGADIDLGLLVRQGHGRGAPALGQGQALRLGHEMPRRRQGLPIQNDHTNLPGILTVIRQARSALKDALTVPGITVKSSALLALLALIQLL